jgi:hypothetical protein
MSRSAGPPDDGCRPARSDAVDRLVGQRVGGGVLSPRDVDRRPAIEGAERLAGGLPQRDELRVLDPPAAGQLLDDQLGVEQHRHLAGTELARQLQRPDDGRVLGDVVRLDAEVVGDRGVGRRSRVGGVRSGGVDQDRPG